MEVINTVVGKIVEVLTEHFLTSMGRRIGYVVHYKKNIEELEAKVQNLQGVKGRIEGKVDIARKNGEVIETDVLNWLTDVNKKEDDLDRLLVDRENIKSCFHVRSRYRLGKKGKKLLYDVSGIIEGGAKFDTVGHPIPLVDIWYTSTTGFESFESRELVQKQIIEVLKDDMIYIIGIHGMPGMGKTRMAEEIAKQTQQEKLFDEVAKAVFSQNPDLKKIQKELAECLNMSFKTETEIGRKGELCNRLKNGKRILVIIDDIWNDETKLEEIGIPSTSNHIKGCKVLLTSRREDVCTKMGVQENFPIGLLQEYEAWNLFKKTVGDFVESPHEIHSVAKQVCRECNCLPLAIVVVGATLSNQKEKHVWDDALVQLSNCRGYKIEGVTEKLYSRIEWSYKYQKQLDVKSCFLYCSLFPEDAEIPIDDLVMYGVATRFLKDNSCIIKTARDRTLVLVDILKKSHLLLEGQSKDFVKMHDVIRDVAILIASNEGFLAKSGVQKWPEKDDENESRRVISVRSKDIWELPCELECPELCTLVLECSYNRKPQVPDSFFKGSEKLQVLDLGFVRLPSSPLNLVYLRMLRLYACEQVNLTFLKGLRNLEILSIVDSNLKEVVVEVGQLTSLRWLDLSNCKMLKIISSGVIKSLSNIEELYFPFNFKGWGNEGNGTLDELNSLTRLTILQIHIGDGLVLPNELCFELLNRFKISIGRTSFDFWEEDVEGARMLKLECITLRKEFTILMAKADVLLLERVEGLKNVLHFGDGKGFLDLNYLKIRSCNDMEHLLGIPKRNLQTQGSFSKLSVLVVENCTLKFLFFPSMARALLQLQKLILSNCKIMEEIILDDEQVMDKVIFHQLRKITLGRLPILRSIYGDRKKASTTECSSSTNAQALFNEKVSFPALEQLDITKLNSLTTIWDNQLLVSTSFQRLTSLSIDGCCSLRNVFSLSIARNLQQLQDLRIINCKKLEEIITIETVHGEEEVTDDEIIVFPQLKEMKIERLPNLKSFWFGSEKAAVENDIPQVQALFNHKVSTSFQRLTSLSIDGCCSLRNVFSLSIARNFQQLQDLRIINCKKIEEMITIETLQGEEEVTDDEIIVFPQLKEMKLESLPNLKSFWSGSGKAAVENDIPQVQALFNHKVSTSFSRLTLLNISGCQSLINVFSPSVARNLRQLQYLTINNCEKIEEIIAVETVQGEEEVTDDEIIVFPQLKNMKFHELPNLKSFWSCTCVSNKEAEEDNIPQVHALFNYKVKFPSLEEFSCKGSKNNLKEIWNTTVPIDYFCKLRRLRVGGCDELLSVAPSKLLGSFQNLEELYLFDCPLLEEIFKVEGRSNNVEEGIVVARDKDIEEDLETISELPSLVKMDISECPKLKSVTFNASKEKVAFPILEDLTFTDGSIFEDIWYGHVPTGSFSKVRKLTMVKCSKVVNASTMLQGFEVVEELTINSCSSLEVVFNLEGFEDRERGPTVSSRIMDPQGLLAFHGLRSLSVYFCHSLKYLFSLSMARNLTEIEHLNVGWCDAIEEVIRNEDQGEEDGVMDEIVFPKLQSIELRSLAKLTSFCGANNAFKLPSLQHVQLINCPKMQTFTSGQISTQLISLFDDKFYKVSDLNKYVEQCVEKRKSRKRLYRHYVRHCVQERKGRDAEETSLANKIEETSEETRLGDEIKDDEETS